MSSSSQLSFEIKKISDKQSCSEEESYIYSPNAFTADEGINGYPYIDQVIYREWTNAITFKNTSTVFQRVDGEIKWFKSKVNNNLNNPIFIEGVINDDFWEPVNNNSGTNVFVKEFVYGGGAQSFVLDESAISVLIVTLNGNVLKKIDYSIIGSIITILPPNEISVGSEITVVGIYGTVVVTPSENEESLFTWNTGDSYTFDASFNILEVKHLFVQGIDYIESEQFNIIAASNQFEVINTILEDGDKLRLVYIKNV